MKSKFYYIIAILFLVIWGCSKDDDTVCIKEISPTNISFVNEDGSAIIECIDEAKKYAVAVTTQGLGEGEYRPTKIDYTVNGIVYSMTFSTEGVQRNLVQLVDGTNIAQLVATGNKSAISYIIQDDFQSVD